MKTIREYFQQAIEKAGSGNKLAAALKTTGGNITRVMIGAGFPGDETVIRLADYLGENREKLLLINQTERAPEAARASWEKVFKKFAGAAMLLFCAGSLMAGALPHSAERLTSAAGNNVYYVKCALAWIIILIFPPAASDKCFQRSGSGRKIVPG